MPSIEMKRWLLMEAQEKKERNKVVTRMMLEHSVGSQPNSLVIFAVSGVP